MSGRPCETGPEVATLIAYGMTPEEVVDAFGIQARSVVRALQRAELYELVPLFAPLAWAETSPETRADRNRRRRERRLGVLRS